MYMYPVHLIKNASSIWNWLLKVVNLSWINKKSCKPFLPCFFFHFVNFHLHKIASSHGDNFLYILAWMGCPGLNIRLIKQFLLCTRLTFELSYTKGMSPLSNTESCESPVKSTSTSEPNFIEYSWTIVTTVNPFTIHLQVVQYMCNL